MSFQALVSGSECAAPVNPLAQVLKHAEGDRSLQQDRLNAPSSSRLHHLPGSSSSGAANEQDLALARQFFESASAGHGIAPVSAMQHPADFLRMRESNPRFQLDETWAIEQQQRMRAYENTAAKAAWASEFGGAPQESSSTSALQISTFSLIDHQVHQPNYLPPMYGPSAPIGMGFHRMGVPTLQYGMNANLSVMDQGKGKAREADFEAAFARITESLIQTEPQTTQTSQIVESTPELEPIVDALKSTSLNAEEGDSVLDFQQVWNKLQSSDLPPPKEDMARWEAEFSQMMNAERDELDEFGTGMQSAWEGGLGNFDDSFGSAIKFDDDGLPMLGDYVFEQNNKYFDSSLSRSLLDETKLLLENNGSLSEAALMLEAAIQQGELGEGGYEAWILLGEIRNMDEREDAGMRALLQGVNKAEEAGAAGAGMLSLAISFTNESYDRASHSMLLRWFRARFPDVYIAEETIQAISTNSAWDTHSRITELFLDLARSQHGQNTVDPDLQIALGVLFYTNAEYERAQDCFATALNMRPKDYLLWNRLGSSLSNGNKPEEALGAYREALQLRPTYTRAIYNVGVACLNIGADKEAAEHFLSALSLQEATNGNTSDQLWFTLRRAFLSMKRSDLADLARPESKSSLEIFRKEGFDF